MKYCYRKKKHKKTFEYFVDFDVCFYVDFIAF